MLCLSLFNEENTNLPLNQWVPVSSTIVSYRLVRDVSSNPTYTKSQLVFWPLRKKKHNGADAIDSNGIVTIKKIK